VNSKSLTIFTKNLRIQRNSQKQRPRQTPQESHHQTFHEEEYYALDEPKAKNAFLPNLLTWKCAPFAVVPEQNRKSKRSLKGALPAQQHGIATPPVLAKKEIAIRARRR